MEKPLNEVYVGLGGNIGDSISILKTALREMSSLSGTCSLICSSFYSTKPISDIPQRNFVNAACRFYTPFSALQLLSALQQIERKLGREKKSKNEPRNTPRTIDLDILFFNKELYQTPELTVPHPAWNSRLFVLLPLSDITDTITVPYSASKQRRVSTQTLVASFPVEERTRLVQRIH